MDELEKRREKRKGVSIEIIGSIDGLKSGTIKNLSLVGALIVDCNPEPDIGSLISLRFRLPFKKGEVAAKAKVMWHNKGLCCIGVLFYGMKKDDLYLLKDFLEAGRS